MSWYFIFLNFFFAALVVGGICGLHAWAIATQQRDWPGWQQETASTQPVPKPALTADLTPAPAIG